MWDSANIGKLVLDKQFDLSPTEAQASLIQFCSKLRAPKGDKEFIADPNKVRCWIEDFEIWYRNFKSISKD